MLLYKFNRHLRRKSCHAKRATAFVVWAILLADDHNLNGSGPTSRLIPVNEVNSAEFTQIKLTCVHYYRNVSSDDRGAKMPL